jgi:hypothetical protein
MKKRYPFLAALIILGLIVNSCKKTGQTPIATLFTGGTWKLASIEVKEFVGNQGVKDTTMNDTCSQYFTFNLDKTCTYTNFNCMTQTVKGNWSLTQNQLFLNADVTLKDTSKSGSSQPFINTQIQTLGQYSMVLNTGDIAPNYSLTQHRRIVVYGFVRQTSVSTN